MPRVGRPAVPAGIPARPSGHVTVRRYSYRCRRLQVAPWPRECWVLPDSGATTAAGRPARWPWPTPLKVGWPRPCFGASVRTCVFWRRSRSLSGFATPHDGRAGRTGSCAVTTRNTRSAAARYRVNVWRGNQSGSEVRGIGRPHCRGDRVVRCRSSPMRRARWASHCRSLVRVRELQNENKAEASIETPHAGAIAACRPSAASGQGSTEARPA